MQILSEFADAVVAALNAGVADSAFAAGINFTAERFVLPQKNLKDYAGLTVLASALDFEKKPLNPRFVNWSIDVDVLTIQKVNDKTSATLDALLAVVGVMASKAVLETVLTTANGHAEWTATASRPYFDRDRLMTKNTFYSKVTYTYTTNRHR